MNRSVVQNFITVQQKVFLFLICLRGLSEIINAFFWQSANYLTVMIIMIISYFYLIPDFILNHVRHQKFFFQEYGPILLYLVYLILRVNFTVFSLKFLLSEIIVYFFFIFVLENCRYNSLFKKRTEQIIIVFFKFSIIVGCVQLLLFFSHSFSFISLILERPVIGVYFHSNIYAIFILPLSIYFWQKEQYIWSIIAFISSVGTGTRSAFIIFFLCLPIIFRLLKKQKITKKHFFIFLGLVVIFYVILIYYFYTKNIDYVTADRLTANSFVWRLGIWNRLLQDINGVFHWLFGATIGAAHVFVGKYMGVVEFAPHNDYLKLLFDTGIIGFFLFLRIVVLILKRFFYVQLFATFVPYILMLIFLFTDNYLFYTTALFLFVLIAIELSSKGSKNENFAN